jgi:hypothetical protein
MSTIVSILNNTTTGHVGSSVVVRGKIRGFGQKSKKQPSAVSGQWLVVGMVLFAQPTTGHQPQTTPPPFPALLPRLPRRDRPLPFFRLREDHSMEAFRPIR